MSETRSTGRYVAVGDLNAGRLAERGDYQCLEQSLCHSLRQLKSRAATFDDTLDGTAESGIE